MSDNDDVKKMIDSGSDTVKKSWEGIQDLRPGQEQGSSSSSSGDSGSKEQSQSEQKK